MKHRIAISLVATLAVTLGAGCNDKITSDSADPGGYTCPGDCVYLTRDNPVLTNDSLLLQSTPDGIFERSELVNDAWYYRSFEFKIFQSGHNLSRGTDTETTLAVWPSKPGVVEPVEGGTAPLAWSIPGAKVGYSDLTMSVDKNRSMFNPTQTVITRETEKTKLRLRPDIILVPVQVAQFVADYNGAMDPRTTDVFNEPRSRLFFDEAWVPSIVRVPREGILDQLVGHWKDRNTDEFSPWAAGYTPDSIFQQCGIQFRMVKHVEVDAAKEYWEMADDNGNKYCGNFADGKLETMRAASVGAGLRADLPILVITRVLMHTTCSDYDQVHGKAGDGWAAISRYHLGEVSAQYVISHELGHVLGLLDLPASSPVCSDDKKHLMCQFTSLQSGDLGGGPQTSSCERARTFAATYAKRYFDTAGTDF